MAKLNFKMKFVQFLLTVIGTSTYVTKYGTKMTATMSRDKLKPLLIEWAKQNNVPTNNISKGSVWYALNKAVKEGIIFTDFKYWKYSTQPMVKIAGTTDSKKNKDDVFGF